MKVVYDYICQQTTYQEGNNDQNILSVFIDHQSVCVVYAKVYQYLLNHIGMKSTCIMGDTKEGHAKYTCYGYLLMNSDEMLRLHRPYGKYDKTKDYKYNYFLIKNCYMETYDRHIMSQAVKLGIKDGRHVAEIKCSHDILYQQVKNDLKKTLLAYSLLMENHCYSRKARYICHDQLHMIEFIY